MRSGRRILLAGALPGLALAALASSAAAASEVQHRPTIKLGRGREEDLETLRKVSLRPSPTPKKGKPTKAEKKAAKRARTRGVTGTPPAAYEKTYGTENHMQLPPGYEVWATNVQPSDEPGAWTCKACGFRGFWRGGPHCGPSGVPPCDGSQRP